MLHNYTLYEIQNNLNPGIEYEIALFYNLLRDNQEEATQVLEAIKERLDSKKILEIIAITDTGIVLRRLNAMGYSLEDVSFETQNDQVGPSDLVMYLKDFAGDNLRIGLSIKYANTCTLNVTGRNFISESQIAYLRSLLPHYTEMYINEMNNKYGHVSNWFRKRKPSETTDEYIDKIRDAVLDNWSKINNKSQLLSALFHANSPIDYWVVTYTKRGYTLNTIPRKIDASRADDITIGKMDTSYVAFYLDGYRIGHMQVKFNNGFVEKCKKQIPDLICENVRMAYGQPFSSWNFSVEN